jgi:hypothetical protein
MTTMKDSGDLGGDLGRRSEFDDVDLFGLDEFGAPVGLAPLYGAMIGTGAGTLAAIGVRSMKPEWGGKSELIGLAAGVLAGGLMVAFPGTRHAGWVAMASAGLNNGLRAVEQYYRSTGYGPFVAPAVFNPANAHPLGEQRIERRQGLGFPQIENRNQLMGLGRSRLPGASLVGPGKFNQGAGHWGTSPMLMVPRS